MNSIVFSLFAMLGGLAFFLFGMRVMSQNLEKMAGGSLEHLLQKMTANPLVSLLLGAVITIAMQSSSATTVMLVGLVNSGLMQFARTVSVIFGANIGTTLTSWILSLSSISGDNFFLQLLKPENFSPILAFIGVLMIMFSKKERKHSIGSVFVGFAVLMYGMTIMANAVRPLAEVEGFRQTLLSFRNPLLAVLLGTVFTAIIQSSAASIGILQALSMSAVIPFSVAIPIVMGQNIGTCATSLISCIGTGTKAKRVAVLHVSIKIIGAVICLTAYTALDAVFDFALSDMPVNPFTIALVHTLFNVAITCILMPFSKLLVKMTEKLVPEHGENEPDADVPHIDDRLFRQPSVVLSECDNGANRMAQIAFDMMLRAMENLHNYSENNNKYIEGCEEKVDRFEDVLGTYLVRLSSQALSETDSRKISKMLHTIGDFERLGDHAVNLVKVAKEIHDKKLEFSFDAHNEMSILGSAIKEIVEISVSSFVNEDMKTAYRVEPLEEIVDDLCDEIKLHHVQRVQTGNCTLNQGFVFNDLLTNFERIADHCSNIAVEMIELESDSFDTHEYLNSIKDIRSASFNQYFEEYKRKYAL